MNLIEESFQNKEEKKKKTITKIILIAIILVVIIIISIITYLAYIENAKLKLAIDGQPNEKLKQLINIQEDGTIYMPIKEIASYFGYESFNGEYNAKSEDPSRCYVQSENEIANFTLGSNKIYKLDLSRNDENYEYIYSKNPVKSENGILYATDEAIQQAFNIFFEYDKDQNRINIYTLPYLIQNYTTRILDYGYSEISETFVNQKAILQDILIVRKDKERNQYGVIDTNGNVILEAKYDSITYLPNTADFLVETNKKVGILSKTKETKVQIMYDSIELMDSDAGLYIVKKDNKYGVIDIKGNTKMYIEYDNIGIDTSRFEENGIKNKYILANNLIPVKQENYWGLFDKSGKQVVDFKYDSIGYIASSNKNALNLLVIPEYNVLVACKDKKYTLINSSGEQLFEPVADDIYMSISGGERHYYISVNDQTMDAEKYLDRRGIASSTPSTNNTTTSNTQNTTTNTTNTTTESNLNTTTENITEIPVEDGQ